MTERLEIAYSAFRGHTAESLYPFGLVVTFKVVTTEMEWAQKIFSYFSEGMNQMHFLRSYWCLNIFPLSPWKDTFS